MSAVKSGIAVAMLLLLAACANTYGSSSITGGYSEKEIEPGIWRVYYGGNGFTTYESVQTYWLYRCADLAQQKGYEGFEVLSGIRLVQPEAEDRTLHLARGAVPIIVPMYGSAPKPYLEADVRFLRRPFEAMPPKVFDAAALKRSLDPLVNGPKCSENNVCPHVHRYLFPEGTLPPPPAGSKT